MFLKACQENFHLKQADLFDITDLEDLNRRRGGFVSNVICYGEEEARESSDHTINSSDKLK